MRRPFALILSSVFLLQLGSFAGTSSQAHSDEPRPGISTPASDLDPQVPSARPQQISPDEKQERELEKERRKQRWREIKKDSEQLLETATELKQYVDKAGENVMSIEVLRKAQEMEKLSKSLQKKMKGE